MNKNRFLEKYGLLLFMAPILLALDQYTKFLARTNIRLHDSVSIIDGFFNLTLVFNKGAAFSFLANVESEWVGRFFIVASITAIIIIVALFREIEMENKPLRVSLALILSGAVGNLVDRFMFGKVTDFLDFYVKNSHWPAFNVADSCITIGVIVIFAEWIYSSLKKSKN